MAVRALLQRINETRDLSPVLEPRAVREARKLAQAIEGESDLEPQYLLGWFHWHRYQALPAGEGEADLAVAVQALAVCFMVGIGDLPDPLLPRLATAAAPYALRALHEARTSPRRELVQNTAELWERMVRATPPDDPYHARRLTNLGVALQVRFEYDGAPGDLDDAIGHLREAMRNTPVAHPERTVTLSNLGAALQARYGRTGAPSDLDAAIDHLSEAVRATPAGEANRTTMLSNLGGALQLRFGRTGDIADLDAAIDTGGEAVRSTPAHHPDRAMCLTNLAVALRTRYEYTEEVTDLDAAIGPMRDAVHATPTDDLQWGSRLSTLAAGLQTRSSLPGGSADLDSAVDMLHEAVRTTTVFRSDGGTMLAAVGGVLWARFGRGGAPADLDATVEVMLEALRATVVSHPKRGARLSNLGAALQARFERTGNLADLNTAIDTLHAAVRATPADGTEHGACLSNLGCALRARFDRTGALTDLDGAIDVLREAARALPPRPEHAGYYLSNLGSALRARFDRTGEMADLDAAVDAGRDAVRATPHSHLNRAGRLSNLGTALHARFERTGILIDLDDAIDAGREAVDTSPANHPNLAMYLSNSGNALRARFEASQTLADANGAIDHLREAVRTIPSDHPHRTPMLSSLANALHLRFERTGTKSDLDAAVLAWVEASKIETAVPAHRVRSAWATAALLAEADAGRAAEAAETAVRLLPQLTPLHLERTDQQHVLGGFAGLAADAAALALASPQGTASDRAARALQLLEAGRSILLSQALDVRSDLTDLSRYHPRLARRFAQLRDRLNHPPDPVGEGPFHGNGDRHRLAEDFNSTLDEIRGLDGFTSFALPPTTAELLKEASQGPVVVFNVSDHRSDALLLTSDGIAHRELPDLAAATVRERADSFRQAQDMAAVGKDKAQRRLAQRAMVEHLEWLWDAAAGPVLAELEQRAALRTAAVGDKNLPRVWWAPGGLLGLLPLHAAGYHTDYPNAPHPRTVMDRVISSYTPTVRALRHARENSSRTGADRHRPERALIVSMPTTPGLPDDGRLEFADAEAAMLHSLLPHSVLLQEPAPSSPLREPTVSTPTKENVLTHLPECEIVHFACHGDSDASDPSKSRMLLHDHADDPFTVASLAPITLQHAQLAYLSACRTAAIDRTELLDEAIHLTSAFQLAGFPHVIGTLWEIDDQIAVSTAEAFYTALSSTTKTMDPNRSAEALHRAVRSMRDGQDLPAGCDRTRTPLLWAAYLHAGA